MNEWMKKFQELEVGLKADIYLILLNTQVNT